MLVADSLVCARKGHTILAKVSFALAPGEVLGVLGANGAGKSTLLATLAGELPPGAGALSLDGRPLHHWTAAALARRRAVLPQAPELDFDLVVSELVAIGAYPFPALSPDAVERLVHEASALIGIDSLLGRRYASLSGGERQRVQFARVLVQLLGCHCDAGAGSAGGILFLDEPTSALDPRHQILLLHTAHQLARQRGVAVFVILHDVNLAAVWSDRLLLLADGEVIALGTPAQVLTEAHLTRVYRTPARVIARPAPDPAPWVMFGALPDEQGDPAARPTTGTGG